MKSFELMSILIPDKKVDATAKALNISRSLIYMERRDRAATGTRNTIDRLDAIAQLALEFDPVAVRLLGERYLNMFTRHQVEMPAPTEAGLLLQIGEAVRRFGEAISALSGKRSLRTCTVEVAQAKAALEKALAYVTQMEEQNA